MFGVKHKEMEPSEFFKLFVQFEIEYKVGFESQYWRKVLFGIVQPDSGYRQTWTDTMQLQFLMQLSHHPRYRTTLHEGTNY